MQMTTIQRAAMKMSKMRNGAIWPPFCLWLEVLTPSFANARVNRYFWRRVHRYLDLREDPMEPDKCAYLGRGWVKLRKQSAEEREINRATCGRAHGRGSRDNSSEKGQGRNALP